MKKLIATILVSFLIPIWSYCQLPTIDVVEKTFKISGEENLYYGFDKGDKIILDFEVVKGKALKEVEILEYPSTSKFMDYKTSMIEGKEIQVPQKGIYIFRFKNSGIGGKVCKIKIQRQPATEKSVSFNSNIIWKTQYDTTIKTYEKKIIVGYDTSYVTKYRKKLANVDTNVVHIIENRQEWIHSTTAIGKNNFSDIFVQLPPNKTTELQTVEVISWAYWLGSGNEANESYEVDKGKLVKAGATLLSLDPIVGLALGTLTNLHNSPHGDNIQYSISGYGSNGETYLLGQGNSVISSGRNDTYLQGNIGIRLVNDNFVEGFPVHVKLAAITITKTYLKESYKERIVKPIKVNKTFNEPVITSTKVPVLSN